MREMTMVTQPIEARTLRELAYQAIKDSILRNEMLPGEDVLITSVAASLRISQTPVREAAARLAADGLIEHTPHRTLRVARLNEEDVREVYEVRRLLEPFAAACAAVKTATTPALSERLRDLAKSAERIARAAASALSREEYLKIDLRLHEVLLESLGNRLLRELLTLVGERSIRIRTFAEAAGDTGNRRVIGIVTREHIRIIRALLDGNPESARDLVIDHLTNGEARTISAIRGRLAS
jgi:DNA-binding GntR family transcriptional regulator